MKKYIASALLILMGSVLFAEITSLYTFPGGSDGDIQVNEGGVFGGRTLIPGTNTTISTTSTTIAVNSSGGGGGSPVSAAYGAIYLSSGSATQANVSTTPVKLSIFNVDGVSAQTTVSSANDSITVTTTSVFNVSAYALQANSQTDFEKYYYICVNGSTRPISQKIPALSNINVGMGGVLSLTNGDIVTFCAMTSSLTVGVPLTFTDAQLVVSAVGGAGGSGGGGGSSSLEVFSNFDATRTSPTASISLGDAMKMTVSGSTSVITVDASSVTLRGQNGIILNQNTLQSGATFYVSSGTVSGKLSVSTVTGGEYFEAQGDAAGNTPFIKFQSEDGNKSFAAVNLNYFGPVFRWPIIEVYGGGLLGSIGLTNVTGNGIGFYDSSNNIKSKIGFDGTTEFGGLFAYNNTLNLNGSMAFANIRPTANITLGATHYLVLADATAGNIVVTMPNIGAAGFGETTFRLYKICKKDGTANTVTFSAPGGGDSIDSVTLSNQNECVEYYGDNTVPGTGTGVWKNVAHYGQSVSGGGGSSSLEVFSNFDATRTSPTASISLGDTMKMTVSGSTAIVNVDPNLSISTLTVTKINLNDSLGGTSKMSLTHSDYGAGGTDISLNMDNGSAGAEQLVIGSTNTTDKNIVFNGQNTGILHYNDSTQVLNYNQGMTVDGSLSSAGQSVCLENGVDCPAPTAGSTNYIQNRNTLQSGSTFYVSSGTVAEAFQVGVFGSAGGITPRTKLAGVGQTLLLGYNNNTPTNPVSIGFMANFSAGDETAGASVQFVPYNSSSRGLLFTKPPGINIGSPDFQFSNATNSNSFNISSTATVRMWDGGATERYMEFRSPDAVSSTYTIRWPTSPGTAGQVLGINSVSGTNLLTEFINASGGGSGSPLEVFNNFDATRSSPTLSITASNAFRGSVSGSTYTFTMNTSSVTLYGPNIPAAAISAGSLGASVLASSLTATGVTSGSYTNTNLTVDAQGRITSASNGSAGSGSTIYSATSTASFPFGFTASTATFSGTTTHNKGINSSTITTTGVIIANGNISARGANGLYVGLSDQALIQYDSGNYNLNVATHASVSGAFLVGSNALLPQLSIPAQMQIIPSSANVVGLYQKAITNQTAPFQQFYNAAGTAISSITVTGGFTGLVSSFPVTNVTAGSYTNTNLTVDAYGRITAASNGSAGGGGGASALEVFSNTDATRSSPTASISIGSSLKLGVSGSTATIGTRFNEKVFATQFNVAVSSINAPAAAAAISNSTQSSVATALFDATSTESVKFTMWMNNYSGGTLYADFYYAMTSATSGTIDWAVYMDCKNPTTNASIKSYGNYDIANSTSVTVRSTAGYPHRATVTLTNADSVAPNDFCVFQVQRQAGTAGDTASGDGELIAVRIYE